MLGEVDHKIIKKLGVGLTCDPSKRKIDLQYSVRAYREVKPGHYLCCRTYYLCFIAVVRTEISNFAPCNSEEICRKYVT